MSEEEEGIKVILLGENAVGKTSLIKAALGQKFDSQELTTYNGNYSIKNIKYNIKKDIWRIRLLV